jgi:hypothetical protein
VTISPTDSCRNLGVIFDSDLSFKKHISNVCRTSFYQIRQLRQIRSSLDINSTKILANSLVSSKLDYCNSLYYNLPQSSINRLQRVQNALARVVVPSVKRSTQISPTLRELHWLSVDQRMKFKIASLVFKTLRHNQPPYLVEIIALNKHSRSLRSSLQNKLVVPRFKTCLGQRSFAYAAPTVWNSLPDRLRSSTSIDSFHAALKTHLFPP